MFLKMLQLQSAFRKGKFKATSKRCWSAPKGKCTTWSLSSEQPFSSTQIQPSGCKSHVREDSAIVTAVCLDQITTFVIEIACCIHHKSYDFKYSSYDLLLFPLIWPLRRISNSTLSDMQSIPSIFCQWLHRTVKFRLDYIVSQKVLLGLVSYISLQLQNVSLDLMKWEKEN